MREVWENVFEGWVMLDHEALRRLAEERARAEAEALYPPSREEDREKAFYRLADKYYHEYTTPSV